MNRQEFNELLEKAGLKKKEFAELVGVEYGAVNNWGNEKHGVPYWVPSWLDNYTKSKAYDRVRDEVLSIEGVTNR